MPEKLPNIAPQDRQNKPINPFYGQTEESLNKAIDELQNITDGLKDQAFDVSQKLLEAGNIALLAQAYEIKRVFFLSHNCQRYLYIAIDQKISKEAATTEQMEYMSDVQRKCAFQDEDVKIALGALNKSTNLYMNNHPNSLECFGELSLYIKRVSRTICGKEPEEKPYYLFAREKINALLNGCIETTAPQTQNSVTAKPHEPNHSIVKTTGEGLLEKKR